MNLEYLKTKRLEKCFKIKWIKCIIYLKRYVKRDRFPNAVWKGNCRGRRWHGQVFKLEDSFGKQILWRLETKCNILLWYSGRQHYKYLRINQSNCLHWFYLISATCFGPYFGKPSGSFTKDISCYWLFLIWMYFVCMYIAGEGLKRPQHRDHPWSILVVIIIIIITKIAKIYFKFFKILTSLRRKFLRLFSGVCWCVFIWE
jgi:hypothetical protein